MANETSTAVLPATLVAILSLLEIIFIPGLAFKIVALILTQIAGTAYLFFIFRDFSEHFNYLVVSYSGFGMLLFLTDMGWLWINIEKNAIFAAMLIAFLVPVVFCTVAAFIMRETQRNFYGEFFMGQSVVLAVSLVLFYIYWFGRFNVDPTMTEPTGRFVPFATLAAFIEKLIYGTITGGEFARYLMFSIVIYIPFGYIVGVIGQNFHLLVEIFSVLILPVAVELLQLVLVLNGCDIDDMIFGFLGGLLGIGIFKLLNLFALTMTGATLTGREKRMEE